MQIFMITVFCVLLFLTINMTVHIFENGDNTLVLLTFFWAYVVDQIKQIGTLTIVYYVVVRRFCFLRENEKEFIDPENRAIKREAFIPNLKVSCLKFLEHSYFETVSITTIGLYTVFILYDLTLSVYLPIP